MRRIFLLTFFICLGLLFGLTSVHAQAPGYAEILSPLDGEAVSGLTTIVGSASHPLFVSYELAFTYQNSEVETWFPIVEISEIQIVDDRLGLWDTTGITDGEYVLRLRVNLSNDTTLEDIIENVRVRNQSAAETPTPGLLSGPSPVPATQTPSPTPRATPIPMAVSPGSGVVVRSFRTGLATGALILCGVGAFFFIRRSVRVRWGILRMRRMLWQDERRKKRGR